MAIRDFIICGCIPTPAMPIERVRWDKQDVVTCDERGRATLGKEFANKQVFVYVANVPNTEDMQEVSKAKEKVLTAMHKWARENIDKEYMRLNADSGTVMDKYGNEYDTPYEYDEANDQMLKEDDYNE